MSGSSLSDQLLALGLAKARPEKKKKRTKAKRRPAAPADNENLSLAQAYALRDSEEKKAREQSAKAKRMEAERRKKLNDAVARLVKPASLNQADAEESRFFEYLGKIRKIHVTEQQQELLNEGRLGIVSLRGGFVLLEPEVVAQVAQLKPEAVALAPGGNDKS